MIKYREIATDIERKIISQQYLPGEILESQIILAKKYQTTRVTIQKAIKLLVQKGLVYAKQGSGVYVKKNVLLNDKLLLGNSISGTSNRLINSHKVETVVINFKTRLPTEKEATLLMVKNDQVIYELNRLRIVDDEPFKIEKSLYPQNIVRDLNKYIAEHSVYDYIRNELNLIISGANRVIRAAKSSKTDQDFLDAEPNDPILEIEQVVFLENGTPMEYSVSRNRYDKSELVINLNSEFNDEN